MKFGSLFIFILLNLRIWAQLNPPALRCLEVLTNGDVKLTWIPPNDPGGVFTTYEIFYGTAAAGPYTILATGITTVSTNTFTHTGAQANLNSRYYFMVARFGPVGSSSTGHSDTLQSIRLNVFASVNSPALKLNYNHMRQPPLNSSSPTFTANKEYPLGTWNSLAITSLLEYPDTISVCNASINYQITIADNSGCISKSNTVGGKYNDSKTPNMPFIDSISVLENGKTVVGWQVPYDKDIVKYRIQHLTPSGTRADYDMVTGRLNTFYTYTNNLAFSQKVGLFIGAVDSCGNGGEINYAFSTMHLETNYSRCAYKTELIWNAYEAMPEGLLEYRVYCSVNNNPYTIVGTTTLTTFTHTNASAGSTLCYFIRAVNVGQKITSSSNRVCFYASQVAAPAYVYIKSASVSNKTTNVLQFIVDTTVNYTGVDIYRSTNGLDYTAIIFIPAKKSLNYTYVDEALAPFLTTCYYKIVVKDSCGNDRLQSNISRTMLLKVEEDQEAVFTKHLSWTPYEGFNGGIKDYTIYRVVNSQVEATPVAVTHSDNLTYTDQLEDEASEGAKIEYLVTATEQVGNIYDVTGISNSNAVLVYMDGRIFVPNAFSPNGYNKTWRPITHFVDKEEYKVRVFDRWGHLVFHTASDAEAWDGGDYPGGIYPYTISFKNARGEYKEQKGSVTLVR